MLRLVTVLKAAFELGAKAVNALAVAAESRATERMRMIEWMTRTKKLKQTEACLLLIVRKAFCWR